MDSIHAPPGSPFEPGLTDWKSEICSRLRTHGSVTQNMALDCVLIMRVSNEQLDNNGGIRPIPGNGQMETGERRAAAGSSKVPFEYSVDWEKVEAQAEAEFAAQRARLARRVDDADYPFPEILDYVAGVVVRDFR